MLSPKSLFVLAVVCGALGSLPTRAGSPLSVILSPGLIGTPAPIGNTTALSDGWDVVSGGMGLGGSSDQASVQYEQWTGDFDVEVRVAALSLTDPWASAGLIARATLDASAAFVASIATPSISGCFFQARTAANAIATRSGSFPVNYPNTWLRLRRTGDDFSAFAGLDGQHWTPLGSANISLPSTVLLGLSTASASSGEAAIASFRDFSEVADVLGESQPRPEHLGQSSRLTSLLISEIMYHPPPRADGKKLEFIELFNTLGTPENLSGYRISGDVDFTFPPGTIIAAGGFLVVARNPTDLQTAYGISGVLGPFDNDQSLPNDKGTVRLRHPTGAIFIEVNYDTQSPWPIAADGAGHSLVLTHPSYGENDPRAWAASDAVGGSPGRLDPITPDALRSVLINEFLAHTDDPDVDYIELYNHSNATIDLAGCVLTDNAATNKFLIPANTVLPAGGFISFTQTQLQFALSAAGETIYLKDPTLTRVLDAVRFGAQENGVAMGRVPDGGSAFYRLANKTPGAPNGPSRPASIVINELMYAPISGDPDDQYVELYNPSSAPIDLAGWQLSGGINFTFPAVTIPSDGYLVIARNAARLLSSYTNLTTAKTLGDFTGKLAGGGERIALSKPDVIVGTSANGSPQTNTIQITVDEVSYHNGGRWGQWSHGGGSSLERIDPRTDGRLAANWADSDETSKAPWTIVTATGRLDNGDVAADQLQVLLQGSGECLIDDVQVLNSQGLNLVANSSFETDISGWTAEGTEDHSGWELSQGYNSAHCYHVRAVDRGDNQVNRIRTPLATALAANGIATIQAKVRWLKGAPGVLFRLRGNWLEAVGEMELPRNLGTPGARNSRAVGHAPPAIYEVHHWPVLPAAGESVLVTAQVSDPDGVASVVLHYRVDPSGSYATAPMVDDGTGGDAVAGDGIYTAAVPGQSTGALVAFYVEATDNAFAAASATFPNDAPVRECLVRFGESIPAGNFPVYRIWMTQATFRTWSNRPKLNNTPLDVTFVSGADRVIYNTLALYAGSPYIAPGYNTPSGNRCGYSITFPADDRFLGNSDLVLDWPGGHGSENTALQEQMGYWIADQIGLPYSHRYTIRLHVNGVTDMQRGGVFEAVNQPAGDFVAAWSPGATKGDFYKIERAFEFSDSGSLIADPEPRLENYTTLGGAKKTAAYRWHWLKRSTESVNDFTNVFNLVDAVNGGSPEPYTSQTEGLVDLEEWMGILATEHIIVNFDAYGHEIGKNMYAYKPDGGKWQIYMFDLDWLMLAAINHRSNYAPLTAPLFNADDPTIVRMYNHPPLLRAYYRAIQKAVDGPLVSANCDPVMDAKYHSLVANGVTLCDGNALVSPTAVKNWFSQRRTALLAQLQTLQTPFAVTSNGGSDFSTASDVVTLTGTAPVEVQTLRVNGQTYPVVWTTVTNWSLQVALPPGETTLALDALAASGQVLPSYSANIRVTSTAHTESPLGRVLINEIMYRPAIPNAEFIELYNRSATSTFDLGGWRLQGLGFTFPGGSLIGPDSYLVVAKDRSAFAEAYGNSIPLIGEFPGKLASKGETLSLIRPGPTAAGDQVVATVSYESEVPWPAVVDGASLQLIDPFQENSRLANWASTTASVSQGSVPQWQKVTATGTASSSRLYIYMTSPGDVYIDDIQIVPGATADAGANTVPDGDFEAGFPGPWNVSPNLAASTLDTTVIHSGNASLHVISKSAGTTQSSAIWQDFGPLVANDTYTLSFWYLPSTNGSAVTVRLSGSGISATQNIAPVEKPLLLSTPGSVNSVRANLAVLPAIWINELEPNNVTGLADNAGEVEPWLELYNAGAVAVDLSGWFLTDDFGNLTRWAFPAGVSIPAQGYQLVWLDGQAPQASTTSLHTTFRAAPDSGVIALVFPMAGAPAVLDYMKYSAALADNSLGLFPDGAPGAIVSFPVPTPGQANLSPLGYVRIVSASVHASNFTLSWAAVIGQSYQIQFKDDLSQSSWTDLATLAPTSSLAIFSEATGVSPRRFYRIRRL